MQIIKSCWMRENVQLRLLLCVSGKRKKLKTLTCKLAKKWQILEQLNNMHQGSIKKNWDSEQFFSEFCKILNCFCKKYVLNHVYLDVQRTGLQSVLCWKHWLISNLMWDTFRVTAQNPLTQLNCLTFFNSFFSQLCDRDRKCASWSALLFFSFSVCRHGKLLFEAWYCCSLLFLFQAAESQLWTPVWQAGPSDVLKKVQTAPEGLSFVDVSVLHFHFPLQLFAFSSSLLFLPKSFMVWWSAPSVLCVWIKQGLGHSCGVVEWIRGLGKLLHKMTAAAAQCADQFPVRRGTVLKSSVEVCWYSLHAEMQM